MIVPKSVTPKVSKNPKTSDSKTDQLLLKEFSDGQISRSHVATVVKAAVKLGTKKDQKSNLFGSDGQGIHVQVTGIKVPKESRSHMVKCVFPHKVNRGSLGVALFVKDLTKNFKDDHEPTTHHYNEIIRSANVKAHIDEVIPLRGLKAEYQTFELKRRLSNKYDKFLADKRIVNRLPQLLGKHFYGKKKMPISVDMEAKDLDAEINSALHTSILPLSHKGVSSILTVGTTAMKMEHVVDNVLQFVSTLKTKYPGGWKNIRSIQLKTDTSTSVPLHVGTVSIKDVGYVDAQKPKKKLRKPEVDELSTLPGAQVKVLADGTVKVKRAKDPNWDLDNEEPFVSGSEDEGDNENEDTKNKEEETNLKKKSAANANKKTKKRGRDADAEEIPSKKFKKTADEEESEDEQMYQNELNFMKKMALEEEEMERKNQEAPADDEIDDSEVVIDKELEEDEQDEDDLDESVVDDLCIKGESIGGAVNRSKLTKPSRKERNKNVKSRKQIIKESKSSKKANVKAKTLGKKSPMASFKTKKNRK